MFSPLAQETCIAEVERLPIIGWTMCSISVRDPYEKYALKNDNDKREKA